MPGTPEANRETFIPNKPVGKYMYCKCILYVLQGIICLRFAELDSDQIRCLSAKSQDKQPQRGLSICV